MVEMGTIKLRVHDSINTHSDNGHIKTDCHLEPQCTDRQGAGSVGVTVEERIAWNEITDCWLFRDSFEKPPEKG